MTCTGPDCSRPAWRSGLCHGHHWQRRHGRELTPLRPRKQSPMQRLAAAALAYADAETEDDYRRAYHRLWQAGRALQRTTRRAG